MTLHNLGINIFIVLLGDLNARVSDKVVEDVVGKVPGKK